jgi:hypothetical protein
VLDQVTIDDGPYAGRTGYPTIDGNALSMLLKDDTARSAMVIDDVGCYGRRNISDERCRPASTSKRGNQDDHHQ